MTDKPKSYATHVSTHLLRRPEPLFQQTWKSKVTYVITDGNPLVRGKIYKRRVGDDVRSDN
jgi:hypothetical protein